MNQLRSEIHFRLIERYRALRSPFITRAFVGRPAPVSGRKFCCRSARAASAISSHDSALFQNSEVVELEPARGLPLDGIAPLGVGDRSRLTAGDYAFAAVCCASKTNHDHLLGSNQKASGSGRASAVRI